ncbi:hypothetical protein [Pseudomonas brassicacearum]|uniref:hypothetical protein n=1 Tax=Pseudomonas brassicacearum TaxID=930166 RepID=UPI0011CDF653|nr:hypothetical protein [Pseudomonas brassicacearum]
MLFLTTVQGLMIRLGKAQAGSATGYQPQGLFRSAFAGALAVMLTEDPTGTWHKAICHHLKKSMATTVRRLFAEFTNTRSFTL